MHLKAHHLEFLRLLCERGSVSAGECDGRTLRPLRRLDLLLEADDIVRPTPAAFALVEDRGSGSLPRASHAFTVTGLLSHRQEEVLRYLLRQTGPVPMEHLDGRVVTALASRGLVAQSDGWVAPTREADSFLRRHTRKEHALVLRRAAGSPRVARGEAILRAVEELEQAIPRDAELTIANHPAYADDVIAGLRRLVREMG